MQNDTLTADLLCEFLTEELPPMNLEKDIGETFSKLLAVELTGFIDNSIVPEFFVTPRRFGCIFKQVTAFEPKKHIFKRGPAIASSMEDNQPTNALLGFIKSCQISNWKELEQRSDGYFYAKQTISGRKLEEVLPKAILNSLKKLPIAKNMRWGNNEYVFVRPVHNLLIMFGNNTICQNYSILGLKPTNYTYGHRFMSNGKISITNPTTYTKQLHNEGKVVVNFSNRRNYIKCNLEQIAEKLDLQVNYTNGLLDEVTALVEYPVVLLGEFDQSFLEIPQECLISSMTKHQKYFTLLNNHGKLSHQFLFVTNLESIDSTAIIKGNQKVLVARLNDAKFFYETDQKHSLTEFSKKLDKVIYHNLLGSQFERTTRLKTIAVKLAPKLNVLDSVAKKTASLLKADLTTQMVGEFPELQGVMGKYYAIGEGETYEIANAIEKHYYPRFSGDQLPDTPLAVLMSLTDKLESLVGFWGIGLLPNGEKDPFALRRLALGVARILLNNYLSLEYLLSTTYSTFEKIKLNPNTIDEVHQFILQRLANYLTNVKKHKANCVQSVISKNPLYFSHLPSLLNTLENFAQNPNNHPLIQANKRIKNILEKNNQLSEKFTLQKELFTTDEEEALFSVLINQNDALVKTSSKHNWEDFFNLLTKFNQPTIDFFENVMIMDNNLSIRKNRIALLNHVYNTLNQVCELSELV